RERGRRGGDHAAADPHTRQVQLVLYFWCGQFPQVIESLVAGFFQVGLRRRRHDEAEFVAGTLEGGLADEMLLAGGRVPDEDVRLSRLADGELQERNGCESRGSGSPCACCEHREE